MPVAVPSTTVSPLDSVKMEERKRPAADDIGSTPPLKRQATAANGASATADPDLPWNEDIVRYQKDAIIRQMREYKREKNVLEQHLASLTKRAEHHDDHTRRIHGWFLQLLEDVAILFNVPDLMPGELTTHLKASLLSSNDKEFAVFLDERSALITSTLRHIFAKAPTASPDVRALQERVSALTLAERAQTLEYERQKSETKVAQERYENAVSRYMLAEKKLDRLRSAQVAKLEAQAIASSRPEGSGGQVDPENNSEDVVGGAATETARKEAVAVAEKRKEQLEKIVTENVKLTKEVTKLQSKLVALSDEDYANSDLFKALKAQHEDAIKRLNDLEAINHQLREDAKVLHGERIAHREEVENDLRSTTIEMQSQIAQRDADLIRVKHTRDELSLEIRTKETSHNSHAAYFEQQRELSKARELRIEALESMLQHLQNPDDATVSDQDHSSLEKDAMLQKLNSVESENKFLLKQITSLEAAFKKASELAKKKINDIIDAEAKIAEHAASKAKSEQKYYAITKVNESMKVEVKALRHQDGKSSEIVAQFKDAGIHANNLLLSTERQLAEAKDALANVTNQHRSAQKDISKHKLEANRFAVLAQELHKKVESRDAMVTEAAKHQREAEEKLELIKVKHGELEVYTKSLKKKANGNLNAEHEQLRTMALCNVCWLNFKDTVIKTCGHVCCKACVEKQIQLRSRKCPHCNKMFGKEEWIHITL